MNKQELSEVLKTIRDQADEYSTSEEIEFLIDYNNETDIVSIRCKPYYSYSATKEFNAREDKEVFLEMVMCWLRQKYDDEIDYRIADEEEQEEIERQEEYDHEVDDFADNLRELVDDYNSDHPKPPFSLITQTPYRFVIRAEVNEDEVYNLTIDCDDDPDFFDANQLLQEARDFCEKCSSY